MEGSLVIVVDFPGDNLGITCADILPCAKFCRSTICETTLIDLPLDQEGCLEEEPAVETVHACAHCKVEEQMELADSTRLFNQLIYELIRS